MARPRKLVLRGEGLGDLAPGTLRNVVAAGSAGTTLRSVLGDCYSDVTFEECPSVPVRTCVSR